MAKKWIEQHIEQSKASWTGTSLSNINVTHTHTACMYRLYVQRSTAPLPRGHHRLPAGSFGHPPQEAPAVTKESPTSCTTRGSCTSCPGIGVSGEECRAEDDKGH
eukprot:1161833-Pelagomonas_calceolata.AAC.12